MKNKNLEEIKKSLDSTLIIMASARDNSINEKVMNNFLTLLENLNLPKNVLNLKNYTKDIPLLLDNYEIPKKIEEIYQVVKKYETIIIFSPEHGGHFSAFFKNITEWLGLKDKFFLKDKKIIVISASVTQKIERYMAKGIDNTFQVYGGKTTKFINYNNYSEDSIAERGDWLFQEIIDGII